MYSRNKSKANQKSEHNHKKQNPNLEKLNGADDSKQPSTCGWKKNTGLRPGRQKEIRSNFDSLKLDIYLLICTILL